MTSPDLRQLLESEGVIVLGDHELGYWDGGEDRVLEVLQDANDLSSTSQELSSCAETWAESYHLAKDRANVLRAIDLPAGAHVLEIGAGCGAISRYLGETCERVDALEPVPARARALRARTRDLANVNVFVGMVADLPMTPAYDVIVVIGVLEYVGNGSDNRTPYLDFLRAVASRLRPGGQLVLAIENRLGVKYLAGSPEDHSGRIYDSIEDYPSGTPARTFTRAHLESMLRESGFAPKTLAAFPDYKMTRVVMDPLAPGAPHQVMKHLPNFPSPDWSGSRPRSVDERRLWAAIVDAEAQQDFGNSFVVLAPLTNGVPKPELWPSNRIATYFAMQDRASQHCMVTEVRSEGPQVAFRRQRLLSGDTVDTSDVHTEPSDSSFIADDSLLLRLGLPNCSDGDRKDLLNRWRDALNSLVASRNGETDGLWDAMPHNAVITASGQLEFFDLEWCVPGTSLDALVERCAFLTGIYLAESTSPILWPEAETVRDVPSHLGALLDLTDGWLDRAIDREARFHVRVQDRPLTETTVTKIRQQLNAQLDRPMTEVQLAPGRERSFDIGLEQRLLKSIQQVEGLSSDNDRLRSERDAIEAELRAVRKTLSWRVTAPLRKLRGS